MTHAPFSDLGKGSLLICSPDNEQSSFRRSVILLCEHSSAGSFGLTINRPVSLEIPKDLLEVHPELSSDDLQLRSGGPMQSQQMMLLHSSADIPEQTLEVVPGVYLGGDLQFLQEAFNKQEKPKLLLCLGYAGWLAGQLEKEFMDGDWFLHPGSSSHVFHSNPERLWQEVLREMGGKYTSLSMIPDDLSLN